MGNHLFDEDLLDEKGVNPWSDVLDEAKYRELFGYAKHPFTGVDYVEYYGDLIRAEGCEPEIRVRPTTCAPCCRYTKNVLCCDIHTRERSRRRLLAGRARRRCCCPERHHDGPGERQRVQRAVTACWAPTRPRRTA